MTEQQQHYLKMPDSHPVFDHSGTTGRPIGHGLDPGKSKIKVPADSLWWGAISWFTDNCLLMRFPGFSLVQA